MPAPSNFTIFRREVAAADLAEHTAIVLVRRKPNEQITLHLADQSGAQSACGGFTHADWVGVHPRLEPNLDRVCARCARHYKVTPESVLEEFSVWKRGWSW